MISIQRRPSTQPIMNIWATKRVKVGAKYSAEPASVHRGRFKAPDWSNAGDPATREIPYGSEEDIHIKSCIVSGRGGSVCAVGISRVPHLVADIGDQDTSHAEHGPASVLDLSLLEPLEQLGVGAC